ncbi:MAG: helix-turn-helix domain-containing protein [Clostridiales bacterium]|nr:helix-turn-helix domain-containing protein [Clostridiales bacterium]
MLKDNLVILRNCKGVSQEEIAGIIEISRQAYAKWERGETVPDIEKCDRLAKYYGISIDDLMHFENKQYGLNLPPGPKGKHICGITAINERGQVVIPKQARELLKIKKGDDFIVFVDENEGIALVKRETFETKMEKIESMVKETTDEFTINS